MSKKICVVGLGYVGMPLAYEFSKFYKVIGFDSDKERAKQLSLGEDKNHQIKKKDLISSKINIISNLEKFIDVDVYIVTVPTPIKKNKKPDLNPLIKATQSISAILKKNDVIIYESTMYPGLTEEVLVPIIEKKSKLKLNKDFSVGYSPERISPGLKSKSLTKITKIISASNTKTLIFMREIYGKIIKTGLHEAPNIRTAEAAKILENMQRDLNISLINEASIIFDKLKIKTYDVLKAAKTKWNFIDIEPGLVGGHCISIDPYYLKYKAEKIGYSPKIITSGRYINEKMASYVSKKIINLFKSRKKIENKNLNIGILGLSFKENCSDIRNSQVFKIIKFFSKKKVKLQLVDPWVLKKDLKDSNFQHLYVSKFTKKLDCLIITIKHKQFLKLKSGYFNRIMKKNSFIFDLKNILENIKLKKIKVISL